MSKRIFLTVLIVALMAAGCANQAKHLRVQPIMYMDVTGAVKDANFTIPLPPLGDQPAQPQPSSPVTVASMGPMPPLAAPLATTTSSTANVGDQKLNVRCVRAPGSLSNEGTTRTQCLYVAVDYKDVLSLPVRNKLERN